MTCEDFAPFIDAYVDHELDEQDLVEMEIHLARCDSCREQVAVQVRMKEEFKACLGQERAPEALRERIFAQLEEVALEDDAIIALEPSPAASENPPSSWLRRLSWVAAPLAAAVALVLALPAFTVAPASSGTTPVVEQTIDWHQGDFPIEVTGPESEDVSRWFRNKVDFPVRPLSFEQSATLLGGRIAHVQDRRAAYLLYEVDGTRLSVLAFDGQGLTVPADEIRSVNGRDLFISNQNGYEVAILQQDGVTYAVTSELPEAAFLELVSSANR